MRQILKVFFVYVFYGNITGCLFYICLIVLHPNLLIFVAYAFNNAKNLSKSKKGLFSLTWNLPKLLRYTKVSKISHVQFISRTSEQAWIEFKSKIPSYINFWGRNSKIQVSKWLETLPITNDLIPHFRWVVHWN